jgi:antitoxin PrlF
MHPSTTITSKNQMTLPKQVREDLNLKPGDRLVFRKQEGHYVLEPKLRRSAMDFAGALHDPSRKPLSQEDIKSAGSDAALARDRQSLDRN